MLLFGTKSSGKFLWEIASLIPELPDDTHTVTHLFTPGSRPVQPSAEQLH